MPRAFLSYSHRDAEFARELNGELRAHGVDTWIDEAELHVGDTLSDKILRAIRSSDYFCVILSPASVASAWVRQEIAQALQDEKETGEVKVLPLLHERCPIPAGLAGRIFTDFSAGITTALPRLLTRLDNGLRDERRQQRRAFEILESAYQDWRAAGMADHDLLDWRRASFVLTHLAQSSVSALLLDYLCRCLCLHPDISGLPCDKVHQWLMALGSSESHEVTERVLSDANPLVRRGALQLVDTLADPGFVDVVVERTLSESDPQVKRLGMTVIKHLGGSVPEEAARAIINARHEHWLIKSLAVEHLRQSRKALLLSDDTDFADDLASLAREGGFDVVVLPGWCVVGAVEEMNDEVLRAYDFIILARGDHFAAGAEALHAKLARFVRAGGYALATSWAAWEVAGLESDTGVLPFYYPPHREGQYVEDAVISFGIAEPAAGAPASTRLIPLRTSYEHLRLRANTTVLLETSTGLPLFGFLDLGRGRCYYLNACQHTCVGEMPSPLRTCPELRSYLQDTIKIVYAALRRG